MHLAGPNLRPESHWFGSRSTKLYPIRRNCHKFVRFSLSALLMTYTDERLMAALAIIGDNKMPKNGYKAPAATGTPRLL